MREIVINLIAGLLLAGLGVVATKLFEVARRQRKDGHIYKLVGKNARVQVVVPSFDVTEFLPRGATERVVVPPNLLAMPMAEGGAIAALVTMVDGLRRGHVHLVPQKAFQDNATLTISIGGPSVNSVSADILHRYFPIFRIKYPEHIASFGSMTFQPATDADGALVEDFGFIASVTADNGRKYLVLCGVWSMGTQIATDALLDVPRHSPVRRYLHKGVSFMAVAHGTVDGLSHRNVEIVHVQHV